jgi:hypothetical protein
MELADAPVVTFDRNDDPQAAFLREYCGVPRWPLTMRADLR